MDNTNLPADAGRPTSHIYTEEQIDHFLTSPGRKWDLVGRDIVMQLRTERDAARAESERVQSELYSANDYIASFDPNSDLLG